VVLSPVLSSENRTDRRLSDLLDRLGNSPPQYRREVSCAQRPVSLRTLPPEIDEWPLGDC
jgi:hypothetical protein